MSGICNSAKVCSGKAINEPCSDSSECDLNMACLPTNKTFPFQTICKKLLKNGDPCLSDYDCSFESICSYTNSDNSFNDVKVCMKKYDLVDGTITGYRIFDNDIRTDSIKNGRKCQSGLCRPRSATECICTSIVNVTSDYGL